MTQYICDTHLYKKVWDVEVDCLCTSKLFVDIEFYCCSYCFDKDN